MFSDILPAKTSSEPQRNPPSPLTGGGFASRLTTAATPLSVAKLSLAMETKARDKWPEPKVQFFLLYPAVLKVKEGGRVETFQSAKEADNFVASLPAAQALQRDEDGEQKPEGTLGHVVAIYIRN
ncbi:unnamed protein product [Arctogadus glacialis]